jgi:homoisocitrate dehydrogenase
MLKICLIFGDGIGQEVISAAAEVLAALGMGIEFTQAQAGFEFFQRSGNAIPDETLAEVAACSIALFGATGSPSTTVRGYRSPILAMRKTFDLYANLRPVYSLPGGFSRPGVDLLIVRENTEGLYSGRERREGDTAIAERVITARGSERIARVAFEQALKRRARRQASHPAQPEEERTRLTIVHKANVLKLTDGLFREVCLKVAADFPEVEVSEMLVDAMAMRLMRDPQNFDTLVTTNLFGDILSDEASALMGGLGLAPSANLGDRVAIFEPVHGSAPDIAGKGIANPIGAILSAAMLLEHVGQVEAAEQIKLAVESALEAGVMTPDVGGRATTAEMTRKIIAAL